MNAERYIDVSDLTDRVDELRGEREAHEDPDAESPNMGAWDVANPDDAAELEGLESTLEDLRGNGGDHQWEGNWYPAQLIHEDAFEEYMDEMLEDCGELPKNLPCYLTITVDYSALQQDYTTIEIDGETYLYR